MSRGIPYLLPSISQVISQADPEARDAFNALSSVKTELMDIDMDAKEEVIIVYKNMNFCDVHLPLPSRLKHSSFWSKYVY